MDFKILARLIIVLIFIGAISTGVRAQELIPLEISEHKSVHIVFPSVVKYCDTGLKAVKYEISGNIVKLIATTGNMPETNLTVITEDEYLYTFLVLYNKDSRRLSILAKLKNGKSIGFSSFPEKSLEAKATTDHANFAPVENLVVEGTLRSDSALLEFCSDIINLPKTYSLMDDEKGVLVEVPNIYAKDNYLFIEVRAYNKAEKDFFIDFVNFQQSKRKGILRKVYREELKKPVYVFNKRTVFEKNKIYIMVYVFEKFTIDKGKKLLIEMGEKDGDGFLSLSVNAKTINMAPVPKFSN